MIGGKFELIMQKVNSSRNKIAEFKNRLAFTENILEMKTEKMNEDIDVLNDQVEEIFNYHVDPDY